MPPIIIATHVPLYQHTKKCPSLGVILVYSVIVGSLFNGSYFLYVMWSRHRFVKTPAFVFNLNSAVIPIFYRCVVLCRTFSKTFRFRDAILCPGVPFFNSWMYISRERSSVSPFSRAASRRGALSNFLMPVYPKTSRARSHSGLL